MTVSESTTDAPVRIEDPIIEVRNSSVRFDMECGQSRVLDEVDLDIQRDEIPAVVGESGSGKSMFAFSLLDAIIEPGILSLATSDTTRRGAPTRSICSRSLSPS